MALREIEDPGVAGAHAELAMEGLGGEAGEPALDDERRDALMPHGLVDGREHQEVVRGVCEADPDLAAVEQVPIAVTPGGRRQVGRVAADARLGKAEGRQLLAARLRNQVALLLLFGGPLQECQRVQAGVHAEDHPERRVCPLHLLAQEREGDVVHPRAAVALGNRQPQESRGAHLLVEAAVVLGRCIQLPDARQDLAFREGARGALHLALRIGQREVHGGLRKGGAGRPRFYPGGGCPGWAP